MSVVDLAARCDARRRNHTGREHCAACGDDGVVEYGIETYGHRPLADGTTAPCETVVVAPCPRCEIGYRFEFGICSVRGDDGARIDRSRPEGGPWGPDGFWRGRDVPAELLG